MDTVHVVVTLAFEDEALLERIREVSPAVDLTHIPTRNVDDLKEAMREAQVLYTGSTLPDPADAEHLEWVQVHWAGVDHVLDHPLYAETDVIFTNASGVHAINMGEYVLGLMLSFAHRIPRMVEDTRQGVWADNRFERFLPTELRGQTVGIVGYGAIGREVARLAQAFGMHILAMKRDVRHLADEGTYMVEGTGDPQGDIPDRYYPPSALHSMLGECDHVVMLTPLTEATHHLINAEALGAMKDSAHLINVARGDVVDEEALITALQEGTIAGAGLDVFSEEPLPEDSPLWGMENVILSPHIAGNTPHYNERAVDLFTQNLQRFIQGETLLNAVNKRRNY